MLLRLLRFAFRVADRALAIEVNVAAPVKTDSSPPATCPSRESVGASCSSASSGSRGGDDLHRGPFLSDHEARRAIAEWDEQWRRTRSN